MSAAQARKPVADLAVWAMILFWADQDPDLITLNVNSKHVIGIGVQVGAPDIARTVFSRPYNLQPVLVWSVDCVSNRCHSGLL